MIESISLRLVSSGLAMLCLVLVAAVVPTTLTAQQAGIIIRLRADGSTKQVIARAALRSGIATASLQVRPVLAGRRVALQSIHRLDRYQLVTVSADQSDAVTAALRGDPDVELAMPNRTYRLDGITDDPRSIEQWALRRIEAEGAWRLTLGSDSIVIGFIDTGIDFTHPDLVGSLWINEAEDLNVNGRLDAWPAGEVREGIGGDLDAIDQDGNGYTDDVIGFDFVDQTVPNTGDWSVRDGVPGDEQGHGSTIAGVISGAHDNAIGIAGIAPRSPLMTLRAFDATGNAEDDDVAAAIVYAADNGVRVLNLSFGDVFYSPLMHDAIRYAHARGVVIVASAGNEGSGEPHYPSSYPEVISVAMTDSNDIRNELSNFGSQIALAAPGVEVLSTARDSAYRLAGGTSIAAPYVSGVAALVLSRHPRLSPDEVRGVLELTADDLRPTTWDPFTGAGRLNARRAVELEGSAILTIESPAAETGLRRDTLVRIVGSAHSSLLESWRLYYGLGELPDTGDWRPLTPEHREGRIHAALGELQTAGIPDTVITLRLVLRQTNGRTSERRARILLDRSPPRVFDVDVRSVWRFDERAIGIIVATDDRTSLTAMVRSSGTGGEYRAIALEAERTGLVRTHHLVLTAMDLARGVAHDLYLVVRNAGGDTAMIGSPTAPLSITRDDEAFAQRGFVAIPYELPYGFMLNEIDTIVDPSRATLALNRFDGGSFGRLIVFEHDGQGFTAVDSLADEWLPKDFGDSDADGLRELLVQSGAATRIHEQSAPSSSVLATTIFDDATATDVTLRRTLGADLVDVDGDGRDELIGRTDPRVLVVVDGDTLPPHYFIARNESGTFRVVARLDNPTRPGFGSSLNQYGAPNAVVADFNGDGAVDILIGDDDGDFILHARDESGRWRVVWTEENEGKGATELITRGDFDGDGRVEAVTGYRSELTIRNDDGDYEPPFWYLKIRRFDGPTFEPSTLWEDRVVHVRATDPFRVGASAGDLDGQPGDELAVSIFPGMYVFRWSTRRSTLEPLWWRFGSINNQPIVGDFDHDGIAELGVGDGARITFHEYDRASRGPDVPGGLVGWATSDSSVHVEWTPVADAERYRVYRGIVDSDTGAITFRLVDEVVATTFEDTGEDLPVGRFRAGELVAYAVTAVDDEPTPVESDYARPVVVLVHGLARPIAATASTDSSIALELSAPVREQLMRPGAFQVTSIARAEVVGISSVTYAGERGVVLHLADPTSADSLHVRLTWLFRDLFLSPGDTATSVGVRLPGHEAPDARFIATSARPGPGAAREVRTIVITFNAAVDAAAATEPRNYRLRPDPDTSVAVSGMRFPWPIARADIDVDDASRVILTLDESYPIGALGRDYTVTITGVRSTDGRPINAGEGSTVGFTIESDDLSDVSVYPQPFSISNDGEATFARLPRDARVEILTQSGRLLRTLRETEHNGGVRWDGSDESGMPVATGIYLYRVTQRVGAETLASELRKIAVVR